MNGEFTFQQHNPLAHVAIQTKEFLEQRSVKILPWPPKSPNLNIVEKYKQAFNNK